ncbi:MAG: uroporphyrinogen-III C-methyltransferase [Myxococcales bacterium]|nr:MAG: uroporphyrinogen-III C-methyltransferase [Myxococcales bacterium]
MATLRAVSSGLVYLIGAGPGDPGLITVRGVEALGRCDVVLYDALASPHLLDHVTPGAEVRFVGKRGGADSESQESITAQLVELALSGKIVGRLKGGDPLLFARGAEEALALAEAGVAFEIIPGVTSPVAAAAYAGIPLTHRDLASSVLFLTGTPRDGVGPDGHDWRRLATRAGTLCVLMGMHRLRDIAASLIAHGRPASTPTAVVQWGTRPDQRTVEAPLEHIADAVEQAGVGSPAVVIIGQVVALRKQLRWFDRKPLFGQRILVTRAREQAPALARRLLAAGAAPLTLSTIELHPPPDQARLDRAAREVGRYDWLALTSTNGVARFFESLDRQGLDARVLGGVRVAAIGPGTAQALRERGVRADLVPDEYRGEALAAALLAASPRPPRVLLPRAAVARDVFPDTIRAAGGEVDVVPAYVALPPGPEARERLRAWLAEGAIDIITLTASSTVTHLLDLLGDEAPALLAPLTLASIGPITTATAERAGLTVAVTASTYTLDGLVDALERHLVERRAGG